MSTPAERLLGRTLDGGWKVIELVPLPPNGTGGVFSVGYIVEAPEGRKGNGGVRSPALKCWAIFGRLLTRTKTRP